MNGEKDDDDDDDDDEDDGDDNECTKSGTKAASNRTTAHNSIDEVQPRLRWRKWKNLEIFSRSL